MDQGRVLTPEEVEKIKHTITPIELIPKDKSALITNISAEKWGAPPRCREERDKLR